MSRKSKSKKTEQAKPVELQDDLKAQLNALRQITQAYNLLSIGLFTTANAPAVVQTQEFLKALHEQAMTVAKAHSQSGQVPELNEEQGK